MFLAIVDKSENIKVLKALGIALNCMLIVFGILILIWLAVILLGYVKTPTKNTPKKQSKPPKAINKGPVVIKDDDMMAAVLTATIDFTSETGKDAKLISAREL